MMCLRSDHVLIIDVVVGAVDLMGHFFGLYCALHSSTNVEIRSIFLHMNVRDLCFAMVYRIMLFRWCTFLRHTRYCMTQ